MRAIALHGDFATAEMLRRDVGSLRVAIDYFFDARRWLAFDRQLDRLLQMIEEVKEPPILIGYSRGGSAIAAISERLELACAVVYESPVLDSAGVGGTFPVLQIWNDAGARYGNNSLRKEQAIIAEQIWSERHPVTRMLGSGTHVKRNPVGHCWDSTLNDAIVDWIESCTITKQQSSR